MDNPGLQAVRFSILRMLRLKTGTANRGAIYLGQSNENER